MLKLSQFASFWTIDKTDQDNQSHLKNSKNSNNYKETHLKDRRPIFQMQNIAYFHKYNFTSA